jgi:hypothetical protein
MGFFKSTGRVIAYPIIKPLETARESAAVIKNDLNRIKEAREARKIKEAADKEEFLSQLQDPEWKGYKASKEELENPLLIKNAYQRFEVIYQLNKWTSEELVQQVQTLSVTKRCAAYMAVFFILLGLVTLATLGLPAAFFIPPMCFTASAVFMASAFKYGLYQAQIQERSLFSHVLFFSRPDLIQFLFKR